jgi:predicted Zn-dependent protease
MTSSTPTLQHTNTSTLLLLIACLSTIHTATFSQDKKGSVIFEAMEDELKRNMSDLSEDGFDKPFYISYGISDITSFSVMATMGGLLHSVQTPIRSKSVRVLVGGYDLNDESLDNNMTSSPESNDINVPIDNDYFGIRRALWVSTDNVYKSAARQFKKNAATVKEDGKSLSEIPHRTFAKTPVVQLFTDRTPFDWEKSKWENYVREISAVLVAYPEITASAAVLNFQQGDYYFANSEGTQARTPEGIAVLQVNAQSKNPEGKISFDQIVHFARTPDQFPELEKIKAEVKTMADQLMASPKYPELEEEYTGPVLLEGPAVAEVLSEIFFAPREGLQASNALPDPKVTYRNEPSMDTKIGKLIAGETLTVKDLSSLRTWNQVDLLGSYYLDRDGVAPIPSLTIIENGVLKNVLNDRTLTKSDQTANGHRSGPGVIQASFGVGMTEQALKDKLLSQVKKEGLEFGLILRDYSIGRFSKLYKVTPDGKEELLQPGSLKYIPLKSLKKVLASSEQSSVYQLPSRNSPNGVVSYIVPQGLVFEEVSVSPANPPFVKEENYVESPLK